MACDPAYHRHVTAFQKRLLLVRVSRLRSRPRALEEPVSQNRNDGQSYEERGQQGDHHNDGKGSEDLADQATSKGNWQEDRYRGQRRSGDRTGDLAYRGGDCHALLIAAS